MKPFLLVWAGRALTVLGSSASAFCLSLWIFQRTGSTTQFAAALLCGYLPGILAAPHAGRLIDRYRRTLVMAGADAAAALTMGLLAVALLAGHLAIPWIYATEVANSLIGAVTWPALTALVCTLVKPARRHTATAMVQLVLGAAQATAPLLAAGLLAGPGLATVLVLDVASSLVGAATLLATLRHERPPETAAAPPPDAPARRGGWQVIADSPKLRALLALSMVQSVVTAAVDVLMVPLILSASPFGATGLLATVAASGGAGLIAGSVAMSVLPRTPHPARWIGGATVVTGVAVIVGGFVPRGPTIIVAAFAFFCGLPVLNSVAQTIWQETVDPAWHGRVFSTRRMLSQSCMPAACLLAAPLAQHVFEPMLRPGGALTGTVGRLIGVGPGHGTGLLLGICGAVLALSAVSFGRSPALRTDPLPETVGRP